MPPAGFKPAIPASDRHRVRRLGHWDRQGLDARTVQPEVSRYTYCGIPAREFQCERNLISA